MFDRVAERFAFVLNGDVVLAVFALSSFGASNYLGWDTKGLALCNNTRGSFWLTVDVHAVAHVVDTKHFFIAGAAGFLNGLKNWRDRKEVVFDVVHVRSEANTLGLPSARAVNHSIDFFTVFSQELLDDWCVRTRWAE